MPRKSHPLLLYYYYNRISCCINELVLAGHVNLHHNYDSLHCVEAKISNDMILIMPTATLAHENLGIYIILNLVNTLQIQVG